jgi:hypothetical protein
MQVLFPLTHDEENDKKYHEDPLVSFNMCSCVCVCIYIYICIRVYACLHTHTHTLSLSLTHIHTHTHTHMQVYQFKTTSFFWNSRDDAKTDRRVHTSYIHTYIQTRIHIHTYLQVYHGNLRPRFSFEILATMQKEIDRAPAFATPYILIHGTGMHACMHVCMYSLIDKVSMYVCIYVCMYLCMYVLGYRSDK